MKRFLRALGLCLLLSLSACQLADYTVARRSAIDKEIVAARVETESHLKILNDKQIGALNELVTQHQAREQAAADYLFKGQVVFGTLKTPTRPEMVLGHSIQQTATQLPPASPAVQAATFKDLQTELDETRISTEALKKQYEAELGKARVEGELKAKAITELDTKLKITEAEKVKVLSDARTKEAELQTAKDKIQDKALAEKTREAENAKSVQAIKIKMSSIVGVLALIATAGAIWSPVFKSHCAIAAAVLGTASMAIWFVEGWMVAIAVGLILVGIIAWAAKNHYLESKTATNLIRAIQQIKTTAKTDYDRVLAPALVAWNSSYTKDGASIPDKSVEYHIDQKLMQVGDK